MIKKNALCLSPSTLSNFAPYVISDKSECALRYVRTEPIHCSALYEVVHTGPLVARLMTYLQNKAAQLDLWLLNE